MSDPRYVNISTCAENIDCSPYLTNRMCVAGAQWLRVNESECQCNHFYGFVPSEPGSITCGQHSLGSYLSMLLYVASGVYNLIQLFVCCVLLSRSFKATKRVRERKFSRLVILQGMPLTRRQQCQIAFSAVQATAIFAMISMVLGFATALFTFLNFYAISGVPPDFAISGKDGFGRYEIYTRTLLTLFGMFVQFGALNLCIAWMEVATEADTLVARKKQLSGVRQFALVVELFAIVACVIAGIVETRSGMKILAFVGATLQPVGMMAQAGKIIIQLDGCITVCH
jgi:hypothetical protein